MKLTDAQRNDLWVLLRDHRDGTRDALQDVLNQCEEMLSAHSELPRWRDPVLDPPAGDDLDADGEVAVKAKDGRVFCTNPAGILDGFMWMCLVELASLPRKDYMDLYMAEERRVFEDAFQGRWDLRRIEGRYIDARAESAWNGWVGCAQTKGGFAQ